MFKFLVWFVWSIVLATSFECIERRLWSSYHQVLNVQRKIIAIKGYWYRFNRVSSSWSGLFRPLRRNAGRQAGVFVIYGAIIVWFSWPWTAFSLWYKILSTLHIGNRRQSFSITIKRLNFRWCLVYFRLFLMAYCVTASCLWIFWTRAFSFIAQQRPMTSAACDGLEKRPHEVVTSYIWIGR